MKRGGSLILPLGKDKTEDGRNRDLVEVERPRGELRFRSGVHERTKVEAFSDECTSVEQIEESLAHFRGAACGGLW